MMNIILCIGFLFAAIYFYAKYKYSYWRKRGVPYLPPTFPIRNGPLSLPKGLSFGTISVKLYDKFKPMGCKLGGVYFGFEPKLVIMDPQYADEILKKDFSYFIDRGVYCNNNCPMTVNIFTQNGNDWRIARTKFSNMFTSAKMRIMFDTMKLCRKDLQTYLDDNYNEDKYLDIMETMCCYLTDVSGSVLFGIDCRTFKNPDAEFRQIGKAIFTEFSLYNRIQMYLCNYYPDFARKLGVTNIQQSVTDFFTNCIRDTIAYREKNCVYRKDFVQLLMEIKDLQNISLEEMASQAFLFFAAGFETSANTTSSLLLELGLNQEVQKRVRAEIKMVLKKYNDDISYEAIKEMPLLTQAFNETLRKYPIIPTHTRVCVKEYKFKDSNIIIPKGMQVLLPVFSYHRDAEYFPNPMKWDIDRFKDATTKHLGYMPFGDGPRNCIGIRLGTIQVKMGAIIILKNYRVTVDPSLKLPLQFDPDTFVMHSTEKILLKLHKDE